MITKNKAKKCKNKVKKYSNRKWNQEVILREKKLKKVSQVMSKCVKKDYMVVKLYEN